MVDLAEELSKILAEIAPDALLVIVTAITTAFATSYLQGRRQKGHEQKNVYRGFLKEVRQNIKFAEHNLKQLAKAEMDAKENLELLAFRDDFWKMSLSGYILELNSSLQNLLYETYMEQYVVREKLMMLREEAKKMLQFGRQRWENPIGKITVQEIKDLKPKLEKAEVHLKKEVE